MTTTSIAGRTWHFSHAIGRPTAEHNGNTGGYHYPADIALASDGDVYVLSRGVGRNRPYLGRDINMRIGKNTIDEHHYGDFARGGFTWPAGIAVPRVGNIFVTDEYENSVIILAPDRFQPFPQLEEDESIGRWGTTGSALGHLDGPCGIKFDAGDNLLIVDSRNDRVQKFSKDGEYITGWGRPGSDEGEFSRPWGLCLDRDGNVYVVDWGNDRVQKFTADGDYLMSFGSSHEACADVDHPCAVAVDSEGDVYVSDWGNRRVQVYVKDNDWVDPIPA